MFCAAFVSASAIPDAERRLPHWSLAMLFVSPSRFRIPDAERRLPHWSERVHLVLRPSHYIPDAERRLPHWSSMGLSAWTAATPHSRRRKASASLEPQPNDCACPRKPNSRRRKASASLELRRPSRGRLGRRRNNSRRRKASASLEHRPLPLGNARNRKFQTPKGVCLIGAFAPADFPRPLKKIPDAERRLPHWSRSNGFPTTGGVQYSRRRKASASLEP